MANLSVGEFIDKIEAKRTSLIDDIVDRDPLFSGTTGVD